MQDLPARRDWERDLDETSPPKKEEKIVREPCRVALAEEDTIRSCKTTQSTGIIGTQKFSEHPGPRHGPLKVGRTFISAALWKSDSKGRRSRDGGHLTSSKGSLSGQRGP